MQNIPMTCDSCQTDWYHNCPLCKKKCKTPIAQQPVAAPRQPTAVRSNQIPKTPKPEQPLPITIENFYISTTATFTEIKKIPDGFLEFFKSKGSQYFTNELKDVVVRKSDHWGYGIRHCNWFLKGHEKEFCGHWKNQKGKFMYIGIALIKSFQPNVKGVEIDTFNSPNQIS
jgi:hypothetical protein